ncbi:MAG: hypothetical protein JXQ27_06890 [Acidobacteria bacterium]|nr:hypothetical protein [Acidobacteriota bacterium]
MRKTLTLVMVCLGSLIPVMAQAGPFSGEAPVYLEFTPTSPTITDGTFTVAVYVDLTGITGANSVTAALGGFAVPVAFDTGRLALQNVVAGNTGPFVAGDFVFTDIDRANARGFVTVVNTHTDSATPAGIIHLATLTFQILQPGKAIFTVDSARTIHEGSLASTYDPTNGGPAEISYTGAQRIELNIGPDMENFRLFYPIFMTSATILQGVSVVNEDQAEDADVTFRAYDPSGQLVAGIDNPPDIGGPVLPLHQYVNAVAFLFDTGAQAFDNGWIEVESAMPNLSGFFLIQDSTPGYVNKMDGADAGFVTSSRLNLPLLGTETAGEASVYVVNPSDQAVDGEIYFRASDGTIIGSETVAFSLQPHGSQKFTFTGFSKLTQDGYFIIDADNNAQVLAFEKFDASGYMAAINAQDAVLPSNRLFDAHFASGGQIWFTEFNIINPNSQPAEITFTPSLRVGETPVGQPTTRTLGAYNHLRIRGYELFGFQEPQLSQDLVIGSVAIESDIGIIGSVTFGDTVNNQFVASLPLLSTASAKREIFLDHVAVGESGGITYFTGIAFVNPSQTRTANIIIELYAADGSLTADNSADPYELAPGGHIAQMIGDFLPSFSGTQIAGFIRVRSDVEVFSFMLFGDTGGQFLSAVPVR